MFLGTIHWNNTNVDHETFYDAMVSKGNSCASDFDVTVKDNFAFSFKQKTTKFQKNHSFKNADGTIYVFYGGNLFNTNELADEFKVNSENLAELAFAAFQKNGAKVFEKFNGAFVVMIWNAAEQKLTLVRDHLGIQSLYYFQTNDKIIFSSSIHPLLKHKDIPNDIDTAGLKSYLLFNYNPGLSTFVKNVKKLRPGFFLENNKDGFSINQYWYISFAEIMQKSEDEFKADLLDLFKDSIHNRIQENADVHGAFLSGGMDSSSVVGLMRDFTRSEIDTFSFRCKGKSYDESKYAQIMADAYKTNHQLVEYDAEKISLITELVDLMDEPFSDIGIEVASYILAQDASQKIDYVMTGDGGDELFAGHPVYMADEVAQKFDKIPGFIQKPITTVCSWLPDPDSKKNIIVKAKRFSYSVQFPPQLFSNRWRMYYSEKELSKLVNADAYGEMVQNDPLKELMAYYDEADGHDYLSKTLYGDYYTVVGFYLNRMRLLNELGIEGRFPMLDYRLVEYCAQMPSNMKINGKNEKYILHQTMDGILPDEIVHRTDKLGHSVPMKNWMRESKPVYELVNDVLAGIHNGPLGFFEKSFIEKLQKQHAAKTHNHSHRMWALVVLALWFEKHFK